MLAPRQMYQFHAIAQLVFHLYKDFNRTACKIKYHITFYLPQENHSISTGGGGGGGSRNKHFAKYMHYLTYSFFFLLILLFVII